LVLIRRLNQAMCPAKRTCRRGRSQVLPVQAGYGKPAELGTASPGLARPRKHDSLPQTGSEESGEDYPGICLGESSWKTRCPGQMLITKQALDGAHETPAERLDGNVRCEFALSVSYQHSLSLSPSMLVGSRGGHRKSEGRRHESQRPRGGSTSDDLLLVAGARRHGALDHLFGSHGRHGHGVEEWPANGNHVPRL